MSEKAIEETIRAIKANAWRIDDYEKVYPSLMAHAIAKKLAEGVVWQKDCRAAHLNTVMGYNARGTELTDESGDSIWAVIMPTLSVEEGERVTVTVKKEEGDGQEEHPE